MSVLPKDDGLLGPDAVAWRVIGHPGALIGGLRSLIVQALHPHAMAGVDQHSDYTRRPLDRLQRTTYYVAATAYGDRETATKAVERVKRRHRVVNGRDPVTGQAYSADDAETQVWVHSTEWHSFLAAYRVFGPGLTPEEEDRYIAEGALIGSLLGAPKELVPASVEEMRAYFERMRPELRMSKAARAAIEFVVSPRPTRETLPYFLPLRVYGSAAASLVPRDLRALARIERPAAADAAAIAAARPLLAGSQLPLVNRVARDVVGRKTIELIDSRAAEARAAATASAGVPANGSPWPKRRTSACSSSSRDSESRARSASSWNAGSWGPFSSPRKLKLARASPAGT